MIVVDYFYVFFSLYFILSHIVGLKLELLFESFKIEVVTSSSIFIVTTRLALESLLLDVF